MSKVKEVIRIIGGTCVIISSHKIALIDISLMLIGAARYGDTDYALIFAVPMCIVCMAAFVEGIVALSGRKSEKALYARVVFMSMFAAMSAILGYVYFRLGNIISVLYAGSMVYSIVMVINFLKMRKKMKAKKQIGSRNKQYTKIDEKFNLWND